MVQNHRRRLVLFCLSGVFILILISCSTTVQPTESDDVVRVESPQGLALLTIPGGALPKDVDADQLAILPLPESELPISPQIGLDVMGFDLSPDGLEFTQAVDLTLSIPLETFSEAVQVLHISGDGDVKSLPIKDIEFDVLNEMVLITSELSHFSTVIGVYPHNDKDFLKITVEAPEMVTEGVPFKVTVTLEITQEVVKTFAFLEFLPKEEDMARWVNLKAKDTPWRIMSGRFTDFDVVRPAFSPNRVEDTPPKTQVNGNKFTINQTFTCVNAQEGQWFDAGRPAILDFFVWYQIPLAYQLRIPSGQDWVETEDLWGSFTRVERIYIRCKSAPTPTPVHTTTAEPTATATPEPLKTIEDAKNDPICCQYCENFQGGLPGNVDITEVSVTHFDDYGPDHECVYRFVIRLREPPTSQTAAAISLYNPQLPQAPSSADICLEQGTNRTFLAYLDDDGVLSSETRGVSATGPDSGKWIDMPDSHFKVEYVNGAFVLIVPCSEVAPGTSWMAWTTDGEYCDEVGLH
jgi:hypothetical protein